jgi:hypothetical protein
MLRKTRFVLSAFLLIVFWGGLSGAEAGRIDPGLVGWWTFDELTGPKAADESGNGNHGRVFGDTSWIPGVAGPNALALVDGGVEIADSESLRPSVYTVCLWFYIPSTDIKGPIVEKGADRDRSFSLIGRNKRVNFVMRSSEGKNHRLGSKPNLPSEKWLHIAAVYDGNEMRIYVDGKQHDKRKVGKVEPYPTVGKPVMFGNRSPKMGRPLNAWIDDVRIYNKPLSATEIVDLYAWKGQSRNLAALPEPADRADNVGPNTELKWLAGKNAASHNVYFGTDLEAVENATKSSPEFKGSRKDTSFKPGVLKYETTYYWRIDEVNNEAAAGPVEGSVWRFTILSGKAQNPNPSVGIKTVATKVKLSWLAGAYAESHDIYIGTDMEQVRSATTSSEVYKKNMPAGNEVLDPGPLKGGVYYYWRIDEKGPAGIAKGDIWSFRTRGPNLILQVDLAVPTCDRKDVWQGTAKPGWTTWADKRWADMYMHDGVWFPSWKDPAAYTAGIEGTGVKAFLSTGSEGQLGIGAKGICRDNLGGGGCPRGKAQGDPIANTWAYAVDWAGPYAGDIILVFKDLPAGVYELHSYHNHWEPCKQSTRNCLDCDCGMPPMPSITANPLPARPEEGSLSGETEELLFQDRSDNILGRYRWKLPPGTGKGVTAIKNAYNVAPQHVLSDEELVPSMLKFSTDGSDVLIIYEADRSKPLYPDCARKGREGARGILNAFELVCISRTK